jgi:hypothetical protein
MRGFSGIAQGVIPKNGNRFSGEIMPKQKDKAMSLV